MKRAVFVFTVLLSLAPGAAQADGADAVVQIGDTTYSQWSVTIPVGGTVTWQNVGGYVHTATSQGQTPGASFDTGGLAPGQSQTLVFTNPGTFTYSSAPDCLNGNANHGFNCEGPYEVLVLGDGSAAPQIPAPARPAPATVTVYVDDNDGFQPNTLTVSAGQSIQFVNRGQNTHNAMSDRNVSPAFNTGGIGPGQAKTIYFRTPGTYAFHSSTEPIWGNDAFGQHIILDYVWKGQITVN